jgi:Ca2+-binding RTX toxin-like protein
MARLKQHLVLGTDNDDLINGAWPHRTDPNGAEIIMGLKGSDAIYGLGGNDFIYGGPGDDTTNGGAGNDTYTGGTGSDRYIYEPGEGIDALIETKKPGWRRRFRAVRRHFRRLRLEIRRQ